MEVEKVDDQPQPPLSASAVDAGAHAVAYLLAKNNERLIDLLSEKLDQSK
jgi:hypothetical protein